MGTYFVHTRPWPPNKTQTPQALYNKWAVPYRENHNPKIDFQSKLPLKNTKNIFFCHFWPQLTKIPLPKDMFVASFEILYFYNFRLPGNSGHTCPAVDCRPSPVMAYCYQRLASSQKLIVARTRAKVVRVIMCEDELALADSHRNISTAQYS